MANILSVVFNEDHTQATGLADSRPYDFNIIRHLEKEGYISEVTDYYPAKDGKGYQWSAKIEKRNPMIVTSSEYYRITNCSDLGEWNVRFTIEEMQQILIDHGYEIIIHTAKAEVTETESDGGEIRRTGRKWIENVERILAVKPEDKESLPEWNDSGRAFYLDFRNVFNKLMKAKLSSPIDIKLLQNQIVKLEKTLKIKEHQEWTRRVEQNERR